MAMECDFQASLVNIPDQAMVPHNQEREKADKVDPVMVLEHRSWGLVWLKYKKYELGIEVCRIFKIPHKNALYMSHLTYIGSLQLEMATVGMENIHLADYTQTQVLLECKDLLDFLANTQILVLLVYHFLRHQEFLGYNWEMGYCHQIHNHHNLVL